MIEKRPSLFVFAVRDVWLTSDVAVTVTFSTGFLSADDAAANDVRVTLCVEARWSEAKEQDEKERYRSAR
jgi:hypothetical protein